MQKVNESRVRRLANRLGYAVRKSRTRHIHMDDHGEYMLVEPFRNFVVMGERFNASLADIEEFLNSA